MPSPDHTASVEQSAIGRIVVPDPDRALFYTTVDFDGHITRDIAATICGVIRDRFGIETSLNTCHQVHGATVTGVSSGTSAWTECDSCDALYTTEENMALAIKVADCLPVTIIDDAHRVIANVHSGWRGTVQRVTAMTLDAIERDTPFRPDTSTAFLGPAIRVCCFEVGEEVAAQFDAKYVDRTHAKPHVDVAQFTVDVLQERGFATDRIIDTGLCTRCDGSIFHSYRREGKGGGRNLAIVAQ